MENQFGILISLASKYNIVPYDVLMNALNIPGKRELEDFIIHSIYHDVIQGSLNPLKQHLEIHDWSSEKFADLDINFIATTLDHWNKHSSNFLSTIGDKMDRSNSFMAELSANEKTVGEEAENIKKSFNLDEKKFLVDKEGSKLPSKPETKRFKSGMKNKRTGN